MDLSESMKSLLAKQQSATGSPMNLHMNPSPGTSSGGAMDSSGSSSSTTPGVGYVTEKLYMLLQLYLQNKGWNPSTELLQCFAELKDSPLLPNAAYLQVLASRLALDGQGRLVLRDNGKIVLPFEHFANAVMLKHMSGPHGLHLSLDATMRAVIDSYTIGRDNFGMEKEFIMEVVNSCPNPACRYYKSHLNPFDAATGAGVPHPAISGGSGPVSSGSTSSASNLSLEMADLAKSSQLMKQQQQQQQQLSHQQQLKGQQQQQQQQHHLTNVLMQQNRALVAQQSLEKFKNLSAIEKQRMLAAMCPPTPAQASSNNSNPLSNLMNNAPTNNPLMANLPTNMIPGGLVGPPPPPPSIVTQPGNNAQAAVAAAAALNAMKQQLASQQHGGNNGSNNLPTNPSLNLIGGGGSNSVGVNSNQPANLQHASNSSTGQDQQQQQQRRQEHHLQKQMLLSLSNQAAAVQAMHGSNQANLMSPLEAHSIKINEYMRTVDAAITPTGSGSSTPNHLESMTPTNKDLLALHNGAWANNSLASGAGGGSLNNIGNSASMAEYRDGMFVGQEKIVRVFSELMRNMAKMKTFIRPAMCKPYGKQSESLQKSLMDTIQLVQSLRNCLPASHIPVNSWKSEDRQFRPEVGGNFEGC